MKNLPLTLALFFCTIVLFAQDITFTVLNSKTKIPIKDVHITKGNDVFVTNKKGKIRINNIKNDSLYFSHVRFLDKKIRYTKHINTTIYLVEKDVKLSEVVITKEKKKELSFKALPKMEKGMHGFASVVHDDKIYVFGGDVSVLQNTLLKAFQLSSEDPSGSFSNFLFNVRRNTSFKKYSDKVLVYDMKNRSWNTLDVPLKKRAYHKAVLIGEEVYLLGGKKLAKDQEREYLIDEIEVFDLKTNKLKKSLDNKQNGVNQGVESIDESIVMLGGSTKTSKKGKKRFATNVALYNTKKNKWFIIGKLPDPKETECIRVNDKLYLVGGDKNDALNTITSFNLKNGKWKIEKTLPKKIKKAAIQKKGDDIYIFDAYNLYKYDTTTNLIHQYKIDLPYKGSEMFLSDNKLYILGGFIDEDFERRPSNKMFSVDLNEFKKTDFSTF